VWLVDLSFLVLVTTGLLAVLVSFFILWNILDIVFLLTTAFDGMDMVSKYKDSLEEEIKYAMSRHRHSQRV
jgi:hypothetical protein